MQYSSRACVRVCEYTDDFVRRTYLLGIHDTMFIQELALFREDFKGPRRRQYVPNLHPI